MPALRLFHPDNPADNGLTVSQVFAWFADTFPPGSSAEAEKERQRVRALFCALAKIGRQSRPPSPISDRMPAVQGVLQGWKGAAVGGAPSELRPWSIHDRRRRTSPFVFRGQSQMG